MALYKIDFDIVLQKLSNIGIGGALHWWISSFLNNRSQKVIVDGVKSKSVPVISGVPQGSVLGPLLFLIHISDIDLEINHTLVTSFADDTRAVSKIKTMRDLSNLQSDIYQIYEWTNNNNMQLNDTKLVALRYGNDDSIKITTSYITPSGAIIAEKDQVKDLGVMMSNDASFNSHIDLITESAKNLSSWILRTFKTRKEEPMILLWKTLMLPTIEYCSVLWSPIKVFQIQKLENLQWAYLRKVNKQNNFLNYWETLKYFKLYSLQRRRERYRIIYTWKITEGLVPNINNKVISSQHPRHGRRLQLYCPASSSKKYDGFMPQHGVKLFNLLPKHIRSISSTSLSIFKSALDKFLVEVPDEPLLPSYTLYRRADSNSLIHMVKLWI